MKVVVVGCGSWGTAFARVVRDRGHDVTLACRDPEQAAAIRQAVENLERQQRRDQARAVARAKTSVEKDW